MGARTSRLLQHEEIEEISSETGFSANQIARLYSRFTNLDKNNNGVLCREDFLRIPELAINPLGDRIVHSFFQESNEETVNFRQFMRVLARFRPTKTKLERNKLNSREEKLRFAFKMYDLDGDSKISREELLAVLHMMVGTNISEDQLESIADRTIAEADTDGDRHISFPEFQTVMELVDVEQKMRLLFFSCILTFLATEVEADEILTNCDFWLVELEE
ncbi:B homologous 1-like [Octopus vulgaris]|uniref:B homologous 1-like n=1 Tax=Octopus vulgaris TaxID=6645 RepID=A0AA36FAL0_OCTVU|nr:B homologous 1-like [Octopus vulgaris]